MIFKAAKDDPIEPIISEHLVTAGFIRVIRQAVAKCKDHIVRTSSIKMW